ncbi:TonB-dependent copper receptor [Klebsiella sp. BIGb0407]|uniref:TonB-dependent copper receptor n=1 Tax=Klebsiella sp. BIGb0407 TaxID=2940603 RepID=UPI0038F6ACED|nr:iron complex outermembrane receptor protein [Klebsiella sp. BIGb0407]
MKILSVKRTSLASMILIALVSQISQAADSLDSSVIVVTAPASSPLEITTSLKTPRQPVPASDGSDYLKTIPGFSQIRNGGTNGDPVFRGMFGSRLRILTNNGEMLGACPSRMDAPTSYISPENFDVLTLTKGPQTVLWGAGNSAGTLRFDRETPRFDKPGIKGTASALTASNHRRDTSLDTSFGNENGYIRLSGNKSRSDDYRDGNDKQVPSKWDKWNSDIAIGWTPGADTLLELTAGKGNGEARYAGRGMDGSQFKRDSLGMRFEQSNIGEIFDKFEASVYYNYANHIMDNHSLRSPSSIISSGESRCKCARAKAALASQSGGMAMQLDRRTLGGRMMGTWLWSDVELRSGVDLQENTHRSKSHRDWKKDARFQDKGIFSELTWHQSEQNKLISGARLNAMRADNYSHPGSADRSAILPAGFIRFEHTPPGMPVMFYAGLGYTERFPDYWELFSPSLGPQGTKDIFDTLKSEKTTQIDLGAQYNGEQVNGWISAYLGRVNDFILFRYSPSNASISQADNVNATIMGAETGVSYQLTDNWKTDASLAWSWGKNTSDKQALPQIPPLETRFALTWEKGNWSSAGLLRVVSHQNRIALNEGNVVGKDFSRSTGFSVFSANASYRINSAVNLSTGVDNLFNKTYSEHLNLAGNSSFGYSAKTSVNEPGRTFWGKVSVTF